MCFLQSQWIPINSEHVFIDITYVKKSVSVKPGTKYYFKLTLSLSSKNPQIKNIPFPCYFSNLLFILGRYKLPIKLITLSHLSFIPALPVLCFGIMTELSKTFE